MEYYTRQDQQDYPDLTAAEMAAAYDDLAAQHMQYAASLPYYAHGSRQERHRQAQLARKAAKFYRKQVSE